MIETLKKLSKNDLITEVITHKSEIENHKSEIENLKHQNDLLRKLVFGSKKETHKAIEQPEQTKLPFEEKVDLDLPQDTEQQQITFHRAKPKKKREDFSKLVLPADLPREEIVIEPLDKTEDMVKIGQEETEVLAIRPEEFYVKKIIRPKYAKANSEGVVIAELPGRVILSGKVDESFLTAMLIDKYVNHMPIYRQLKKYERLGVKLNDSTVGNWIGKSINYLEILYDFLRQKILKSDYLQADETTMKVLDKEKKGKTHLGYYWVYHSPEQKLCLFNYHPGRGQEAPINFLEGYQGFLQTDGYSAYDALAGKQNGITLAGCMAHARRYFFEAQENNKELAHWMLSKIQLLYEIERQAKEEKKTHSERLALRKEKSKPILAEMKAWLDEKQMLATPKSPIGKAINYMKVRWEKLNRFTEIEALEIDNNLVENAIRPVALGRKNYLFAGSHDAAKRGAIIYSLIACCKMNNINPNQWLEETLRKLPDTKTSELHKLLPINIQHGV